MLVNPICPECKDNRRVVYSVTQPRKSILDWGFIFRGKENYQCNTCLKVFNGRQKVTRS